MSFNLYNIIKDQSLITLDLSLTNKKICHSLMVVIA
jgi:hypothetical protein